MTSKQRRLRAIRRDQLARVNGGGILLYTLGQARDATSQVATEQMSLNFEKLDPRR